MVWHLPPDFGGARELPDERASSRGSTDDRLSLLRAAGMEQCAPLPNAFFVLVS